MSRLSACLLVVVAALAACAGPGPRRSDTRPAGNADQLAAAALRTRAAERDASGALTLISRAADIATDRADIAWLHVRLCMEVRGCEPQPIEARLRKLDPGNGIVWLDVLSRAQARGDARAAASILDAMSRAEHFDLYWTTLVWRLTAALGSNADTVHGPDTPQNAPLTTALNEVVGWLSGIATPAFHPVSAACDPQRVRGTPSLARCERIAEAMQRSDTTLVEGIGLGLAQRLATPGSPAAIVLDERVATLGYQSQAAGSIIQAQVERDKFSAQLLELMKKLPHEQEVSIAILRWAGRPLTPAK